MNPTQEIQCLSLGGATAAGYPAYLKHYLMALPVVLCCLLATALSAQEFAPPGSEWCFRAYDGDNNTKGYVKTSYVRDTVVDGISMKVFQNTVRDFTATRELRIFRSPFELFYQSRDSVFYYLWSRQAPLFLFKREYTAGERTSSTLGNESLRVLRVRDTSLSGTTVRVADLDLIPELNATLPVKMYGFYGPDRGFISKWWYWTEGYGGENLLAYRIKGEPPLRFTDGERCFDLVDNEPPSPLAVVANTCPLTPYPNPVVTSVALGLRFPCRPFVAGPFTVTIYDAAGRTVGSRRTVAAIPATLNVDGLPGGRYFAVLAGQGERHEFTFVKNR